MRLYRLSIDGDGQIYSTAKEAREVAKTLIANIKANKTGDDIYEIEIESFELANFINKREMVISLLNQQRYIKQGSRKTIYSYTRKD